MDEEVNILDFFRVIKSKWKLISFVFIIVEVAALIITLRMPKIYKSTASILTSEVTAEKNILLQSRLPYILREELPAGLYGGGAATQVIIAMLKSKRMARDIVEKFKLENFYKAKSSSPVIRDLQSSTDISVSKEGVISITVGSRDSELSAKIANFYVINLDGMNDELKITSIKPVATLLDQAMPAESHTSPKIKLNLLIAGMLSIFTGVLLSFLVNYFQTLKKVNA